MKISVVVYCKNDWSRVASTLYSIVSQNLEISPEIILVNQVKTPEYDEKVSDNLDFPWFSSVKEIDFSPIEEPAKLHNEITGDVLFFMKSGEHLLSDALKKMLGQITKSNLDLVIAAAGQKSDQGNMRPDNHVESMFHLSQIQTVDFLEGSAVSPLAFLLKPSRSQAKMFRRSLLKESKLQLRVGILHDYVCEKRSKQTLPRVPSFPEKGFVPPSSKFEKEEGKQKPSSNQVWLFSERRGCSAEENGWVLFKYCVENVKNADCYYVLDKSTSLPKDTGYEDRIVRKGSIRWHILIGHASHFFFTDGAGDILGSDDDAERYPEATFVYLTHGVLAFSPGVYQSNHPYIDLVTCSSEADIKSATSQWGFPSSSFAVTGLARWDQLASRAQGKEILFAPTWRKTLPTQNWYKNSGQALEDVKAFEASDYFAKISSFLQSPVLHEMLETNEITLTAALHFRVRQLFTQSNIINNKHIEIFESEKQSRSLQDVLINSSYLITDYSSVMWDMAFQNKPTVLYQFDKAAWLRERFLANFQMNDVGQVFELCFNEDDLLKTLARQIERGFTLNKDQLSSLNKYIPNKDRHNCKRIVDAVLQHAKSNLAKQADEGTSSKLDVDQIEKSFSGKVVCSIVSKHLESSFSSKLIQLEPDSWKKNLIEIKPDILFVEPNLDGRSEWAEFFFDKSKSLELIKAVMETAGEIGAQLTVVKNPYLPQAKLLESEFETGTLKQVSYNSISNEKEVEVSIIVPVFNSEEYLEGCLNSLVNQRFRKEFEIVAVDDGSTDGSEKILQKFADTYSNFKVVRQKNARQGIARNHGIHVASGKFVTFVDADDLLTENALSDLYHTLSFNETDVAVGLYTSYNEKTQRAFVNQSCYHFWLAPDCVTLENWPTLFQECSSVAKMIRREFLIQNDIWFSASYHEDEVFTSLLFSAAEKIAICKEITYIYFARDNDSGTRTFNRDKLKQILLVGNFIADTLKSKGCSQSAFSFKMRHLVSRYDRFIFKMKIALQDRSLASAKHRSAQGMFWVLNDSEISQILQNFLRKLDDKDIMRSATNFGPCFLLLKYGKTLEAKLFISGQTANGLNFLETKGALRADEIDRKTLRYAGASRYDYYKRVEVLKTSDDKPLASSQIADGGLRYQIGDLMVSAAKGPRRKLLKLPIQLYKLYRSTPRK